MAKWRAGPERAYIALPHRDDPKERVTYYYREGEVFEIPDTIAPSVTWYPKDAAAVAICKRIAAKHMKDPPPPPDDPDDEKAMRKYRRAAARWANEQSAQRIWFGPDPYDNQDPRDRPMTLRESTPTLAPLQT